MTSAAEWIIPGTGNTVLNGGGGLTERGRLHTQLTGCCTGPATNIETGNVSVCCELRPNRNSAQGPIVPPPSILLNDKINSCAAAALTASEARRLAAAALSAAGQRSGEVLLQQRVAEIDLCSVSPLSSATRFLAYAGPRIPPACPPLPPPATNPIPTACVPPPGSRGF